MALDVNRLKNAIATTYESTIRSTFNLGNGPIPDLTKHAQAYGLAAAQCIINEIVNNARVTTYKNNGDVDRNDGTIS